MKKLTKLLSLLMIFVLALSFIGCSSYGKVEKVLKDDGYTLVETEDNAKKQYENVDGVVNVHIFTKSETILFAPITYSVAVIEFKTTEKMIEFFNENESLKILVQDIANDDDVKAIHAKLETAGLACDNCLIISSDVDVYPQIAELNTSQSIHITDMHVQTIIISIPASAQMTFSRSMCRRLTRRISRS